MDEELDDDTVAGASGADEPSLTDQLEEAIGLTEETNVAEAAAPEADPAAPAATAPAAPAQAEVIDPAAKAAAEMYAPLPEHNPRKTHERFAKLIEGHKELDAKVKELEPLRERSQQLEARVKEHEQGWATFKEMGYVGEEAVADLAQFAEYRKAVSSGNFDSAFRIMQEQARVLQVMSGRRVDFNPLAGFQDLDQRVQGGELDDRTALELARSRQQQFAQQQAQQRQAQQNQHVGQQTQAIHQAARQVDTVVQDLMRDPDFAKVEPLLVKQLADIKANYHPTQWPREVQRVYQQEKRFLSLSAQQQQPAPQVPLRGRGTANARATPTSMGDAVLQSLGLS